MSLAITFNQCNHIFIKTAYRCKIYTSDISVTHYIPKGLNGDGVRLS